MLYQVVYLLVTCDFCNRLPTEPTVVGLVWPSKDAAEFSQHLVDIVKGPLKLIKNVNANAL
jgi:hypothetical protein